MTDYFVVLRVGLAPVDFPGVQWLQAQRAHLPPGPLTLEAQRDWALGQLSNPDIYHQTRRRFQVDIAVVIPRPPPPPSPGAARVAAAVPVHQPPPNPINLSAFDDEPDHQPLPNARNVQEDGNTIGEENSVHGDEEEAIFGSQNGQPSSVPSSPPIRPALGAHPSTGIVLSDDEYTSDDLTILSSRYHLGGPRPRDRVPVTAARDESPLNATRREGQIRFQPRPNPFPYILLTPAGYRSGGLRALLEIFLTYNRYNHYAPLGIVDGPDTTGVTTLQSAYVQIHPQHNVRPITYHTVIVIRHDYGDPDITAHAAAGHRIQLTAGFGGSEFLRWATQHHFDIHHLQLTGAVGHERERTLQVLTAWRNALGVTVQEIGVDAIQQALAEQLEIEHQEKIKEKKHENNGDKKSGFGNGPRHGGGRGSGGGAPMVSWCEYGRTMGGAGLGAGGLVSVRGGCVVAG